MNRLFLLVALCTALLSTTTAQKANPLHGIVKQLKAPKGDWVKHPDKYHVQLYYTRINRDKNNLPSFKTWYWGSDTNQYFYPASTVKMPVAFLAAEWMDTQKYPLDAAIHYQATRPEQSDMQTDSCGTGGQPTVQDFLRKLFIVSDNESYNRLYELLGPAYINTTLAQKGLPPSRIIHRVGVSGYSSEANRCVPAISISKSDSLLYKRDGFCTDWEALCAPQNQQLGIGYLNHEDSLVHAPFDFSAKNYISLRSMHDILLRGLFPEAFPAHQRFHWSQETRLQLLTYMSMYPSESNCLNLAQDELPIADNYVKFWLFGADSTRKIPSNIRIFNKVGWAYGFLTDVAYIVDFDTGIEFVLAGTIHVNANEIYNDGLYEYKEIGLPFFQSVGEAVYQQEKRRSRKRKPLAFEYTGLLETENK